MITVYPLGTTIYDPDKCYNGYTLFTYMYTEPEVKLIDMNGNIVHKWKTRAERAKLLKNGNLIVNEVREGEKKPIVAEYDWDGHRLWDYEPPNRVHHDLQRLENGNTLILTTEPVPDEYREKIKDPVRRSAKPIKADVVLEVTRDREVVWEWNAYEHLDMNLHCEIWNPGDWTHINTVQALPENRHYDAGDKRFKPSNILLSPRNLGFILIVDRETKEVVWRYGGNYKGGLSGQHEPHMIEKGLPGEGNIIVYDNGAPPLRSSAHVGKSFILEIDPVTEETVWKFEDGERFYSSFRSNVQRLPNGNTLICESEGPRIFEVTREKEIVWEHTFEWTPLFGWSYRYPYDHCPQLKASKKPEERRIIPPPYVRTCPQEVKPFVR